MCWTSGQALIRKRNASFIATTTQDADTTHGTQTNIGIRNSASSSLLVTVLTVGAQTVVQVPGLRKISALITTKSYTRHKDVSLLKKKKEGQGSTLTDLILIPSLLKQGQIGPVAVGTELQEMLEQVWQKVFQTTGGVDHIAHFG